MKKKEDLKLTKGQRERIAYLSSLEYKQLISDPKVREEHWKRNGGIVTFSDTPSKEKRF